MPRLLDTARDLNDDEKATFTVACRDDGVRPTEQCPLCRGRRLVSEQRYRYCDEHLSWEPSSIAVACRTCKVGWGVVGKANHDG